MASGARALLLSIVVFSCGEKKQEIDAIRSQAEVDKKRIETLLEEHRVSLSKVVADLVSLKKDIERIARVQGDERGRLDRVKAQTDDISRTTKRIMDEGVHVRISPLPGTPALERAHPNAIRLTAGPQGLIYFGDSVNPLPLKVALERLREVAGKAKAEVQIRAAPGVPRSAVEDVVKGLRDAGFPNVLIVP